VAFLSRDEREERILTGGMKNKKTHEDKQQEEVKT
jgi:hypothetical protein